MTDGSGLQITRRAALALALASAAGSAAFGASPAAPPALMTRAIPKSGEKLPVIGTGTSLVFEFERDDAGVHAERRAVLEKMLAGGARVIDTAPSYGNAEANVGALLAELKSRDRFFVATKVGVKGSAAETLAEMQQSQHRLQTEKFDLLELHNVRSGATDLGVLREWQKAGKTRYIGITTSNEAAHDVLLEVMKKQKPEFIQVNYSLDARGAEDRLLPAAHDSGVAVFINLPFGRNRLFRAVRGKALPGFAQELGASSWAQLFLKFILANPAVTCVIPGTDKPEYMVDNIAAGSGPALTASQRKQILDYWASVA
jgi:aryl-alcohol dehydrogenase-like predicted oxidoreductase